MTAGNEPAELRLVVVLPDGSRRDVRVDAAPEVTAGELLDTIGDSVGARLRGALPADVPLSELGLRWGDAVAVGSDGHATSPAAAELRVEGGPAVGRVFALAAGTHVVGRNGALAIDDPALSGRHLVLTIAPDGSTTVADAESRNGSSVDGEPLAAGEAVPLAEGQLVRAGRTLLSVGLPRASASRPPGRRGLVAVNRPPRMRRPLEPRRRPVPAPPGEPQRARLPLGVSLIPLALGVGLYLLTRLPTMLFFSLLSPVMAITTYAEDRRSGRKGFQARTSEYRALLAGLGEELERERRAESAERHSAAPSAPALVERARTLDATLWERRPGDDDFLRLRVGTGDVPSLLHVELDQGGSETLRTEAHGLAQHYATLPDAPVTIDAAQAGTVGIAGPRERVDGLARWLVGQAAALHSPAELAIAAALGPGAAQAWEWLKWLPHAVPDGPPAPRVGIGPVASRAVVEEVARMIGDRRAEQAHLHGATQARVPHVVLLMDETVAPERSLVADVLAGAGEGVTVLWLARERRDLPGEATIVLEVDEAAARVAVDETRTGSRRDEVSVDLLDAELALDLARLLAPARDLGGSRAHALPERVTLLEALGTDDPTADWVRGRWESATSLEATLGTTADGPFTVDLRADGPHGLVAGTTGAGKSELLQTLLASLAVSTPPDRLSFLLVDYKGGAAFKDCVRFPHTVGLVTDLDAHLTRRALSSLNAELQRRERILRDADAKDLAELERRDPAQAPPSLLIAIDEFATLAKEVPDFVEGIVDVAQRGRSLGVHLLLATQRPGGVVSDNIRANTNLRVALRVNEAAESSDVIGAADASRIPRERPGRAFVRTGHGELTGVQTAYVGGGTVRASRERPVVVRPFALGDGPSASEQDLGAVETDLARLVAAVDEAAAQLGLERGRSPWLEPLPASLSLSDGGALGLIDEPQLQRQRPLLLDLEQEGSVLVYGTSGAGKTTFLRTLAVSLAHTNTHVYGLDFATRGLTPLAALPHVGAVIGGDDHERVERLFSYLRATMERRKALFAQAGVFSLSDFRGPALPRIVVLLDGYGGFAAAFERVNLGELVDLLPRLVGDGRPLGIHFAITADRRGAVPNALAGIVPTKLVLRMADEDEFAALGVEPRAVRGAQLPPGRGFLPPGVELQVAQVPGDPASLAELGAGLPRREVPAIEPLPAAVDASSLPAPEPWRAVVGLGDAELSPAQVDLSERHLLVVGPYRSGRSTALRAVVESLRRGGDVELHLLAPRRTPLVALDGWTSIATGEECDEAAQRLASLPPDAPAVVVIDDGEHLAESLGAPALEQLVRRGRDGRVRVVAAAERQAAQRAFSGWLRELRKEEHALLLDPDPDVDGDIVGTRLPRRSRPVFPPGRGYLVERGAVELVQVAS